MDSPTDHRSRMAAAAILFTSAMTSAVRLGPLSTICYAVPYYSCRRADTPVLVMGVEDGPTTTSFRQRLKAVNVDRHVLAAAAALHNEWGRPRGPRRESEGGNGMVHLGSAYGVRPRFLAAASTEASIPPAGLPEVAVIGRSNVGKSSLLNVLTGSSGLARVSDKPGRTTQLCWFEVGKRGNPDAFYLVDMPGYGFALASEKSVEQWAELSAAYLRKRSTLKMVLVLIDSRVGMKLTDVQARGCTRAQWEKAPGRGTGRAFRLRPAPRRVASRTSSCALFGTPRPAPMPPDGLLTHPQMIEFLEQQTKVKYMVVMTKCDVAGPPQRLAQVAGLVQAGLKSTRRQVRSGRAGARVAPAGAAIAHARAIIGTRPTCTFFLRRCAQSLSSPALAKQASTIFSAGSFRPPPGAPTCCSSRGHQPAVGAAAGSRAGAWHQLQWGAHSVDAEAQNVDAEA